MTRRNPVHLHDLLPGPPPHQLASDDGITARSQCDGKQSRMADANHGSGVRPSDARSVM